MKKLLLVIVITGFLFFFSGIIYAIYIYPKVLSLKDPNVSFQITVLDWKKKPHLFWVGPKNPYYVPWKAISANIKWAVILSEDGKFYRHYGVDYEALKNAFKKNLEVGKYVRGGSTITQQLAKNLFLTREKTLVRKLKELILSFLLEMTLTKTRILELYLNIVELGPMIYGVGHGSYFYFGKSPHSLSPLEGALLAALLPGPKLFNPYYNLDRVEKRAKRILQLMYSAKVLDKDSYESLKDASFTLNMENKITVRIKEVEKESFSTYSSMPIFMNTSSQNH